jgi:hypothetical protein
LSTITPRLSLFASICATPRETIASAAARGDRNDEADRLTG